MKQTEKISKQRFTFLPISIWWILKVVFAVAGFALWGWSFVAVVAGIYILWGVVKTLLSCLVSLLVLAVIICIVIVLIF